MTVERIRQTQRKKEFKEKKANFVSILKLVSELCKHRKKSKEGKKREKLQVNKVGN